MDSAEDQALLWKSDDILAYHRRQLEEPYRSTVHLLRFMQSVLKNPKGEALDVACGTGANILHLNRVFEGYRWTGVDYMGDRLFPISRPYFEKRGLRADLINGDMYKLTTIFARRKFDLVLLMQSILCLPEYEAAVEQLLAVTRGWLILNSLFTDFDIDAKIQVIDHTREDSLQVPQHYNIYSLRRFREFCENHGCREFIAEDFEIDIDLPKTTDGRGTYTRTLADGHRLQFSGPLLMPWKNVAVRMGDV
ncbi:MAG: class I SAM-dependent methyltransferase [Thermoanaerobaculia bacterium]